MLQVLLAQAAQEAEQAVWLAWAQCLAWSAVAQPVLPARPVLAAPAVLAQAWQVLPLAAWRVRTVQQPGRLVKYHHWQPHQLQPCGWPIQAQVVGAKCLPEEAAVQSRLTDGQAPAAHAHKSCDALRPAHQAVKPAPCAELHQNLPYSHQSRSVPPPARIPVTRTSPGQ